MLHLAILLGFVAFTNAAIGEMTLLQENADRARTALQQLQSDYDEQVLVSKMRANLTIRIIPATAKEVTDGWISAAANNFKKVRVNVLEPARNLGLNTDECSRISNNLFDALNKVTEKSPDCITTIISRINRRLESIKDLASRTNELFIQWRSQLNTAPASISDFDSFLSRSREIIDIGKTAADYVVDDTSEMARLRDRIDTLRTEETFEDCLRKTDEYANYETAYSNLKEESKRCVTDATVSARDFLHKMEKAG